MRILIIDQDSEAMKYLEKSLSEVAPEKKIIGRCKDIETAKQWLQKNPLPNLIFSVIELPDGLSFEIFNNLQKKPPVIFIGEYGEYAIELFKANGIYYLLKPVKKEELKEALNRYEAFFSHGEDTSAIKPAAKPGKVAYQERFLVTIGRQMKLILAEDVAYFFTEQKIVYLVTFQNVKYNTGFTLERVEQQLNPAMFFRINRQFIINISAIVKLLPASKSRMQVVLKPETIHDTITSFGRTESFCHWMLGGFEMV
ncbi:MAG TPA: LytTR family DNA-binding domain-containing protein [Niastella sp.]